MTGDELAARLLDSNEVLREMDEFCERAGTQKTAVALRSHYERTGEMAPAILSSLKLKRVVRYERIDK